MLLSLHSHSLYQECRRPTYGINKELFLLPQHMGTYVSLSAAKRLSTRLHSRERRLTLRASLAALLVPLAAVAIAIRY